jgi:methyl-accepting chemotaxis protein-1 (serine sensor receptor)
MVKPAVVKPVARRAATKVVPARKTLAAVQPTNEQPKPAAAEAAATEQQRVRPAVAKPTAQAPKLQSPKLVAAGGDDSDWETF